MLSLTHILNFEGQKGWNFQSPANIPSHFVLEPMSTTPTNPPTSPQLYTSPPVTIVLTVILLLFFFIGFFAIYFCRCFMQNLLITWHIRQSPSGTSVSPANGAIVAPGLDPSIITSFPTFLYSSVKEYRMEKVGLECAICLCEFEDDDALRLLPTCCHVFHQECIDLWLESHKSCPFCRRALDTPSDKYPNISILGSTLHQDIIPENESLEATFTINIKDDNEKFGREASNKDGKSTSSMPGCEQSGGSMMAERFARSKSTGHSIVRSDRRGEDEDRFTLRLPEHIQTKLLRGHQATRSCTSFGEFKSKTSTGNGGFDEISTGDFKSIVIG